MRVTVYGSGNEDLMVKLIEDHLGVDYELPLGGAHLAYRAAEAGHDVVLCDPSLDLSEESRERLESAGVELVTDDTVGAEHGEVQILFTPFGRTVDIARRLLDDVREGAVLCSACTCSPIALYYGLEDELRKEREDVGISSFHPAGIPGTETQDLILVADTRSEESGIELATEEQVERCVNLAEDMGYDVYVLDPELVSPIGDMSIVFTVRIVQAICNYFSVAKICGAPTGMIEEQVEVVLSVMAYLVGKYGLDAFDRMDGELLLRSLRNMALTEDVERVVDFFERCYLNLLSGDRESVRKLSSMMVPPDKLVDRIREIVGEAPIQYARRKFFEGRRWSS
ncbi:H(2)-dependent methylenetetrahydromethanopterin dehydrogenase-related protein [Methanopyrus sp.]